MRILFLSGYGDSYGLASHIARQGHDVYYWIHDPKYQDKGKGINKPERIKFYEPYLGKADVIVFDMSGMGKKADELRKMGYPVIGASAIADKLEKDRSFAQDIMREHSEDVIIPEYKQFSNIKEGIAFIQGKGKDKIWVFKPGNMPTNWTFVPRKDNDAVISIMKLCPKKTGDFILQEKVDDGIEISTEGWFNGKDWIGGAFNHTIEEKRFLDGDWGPNCGCMGSVVWECGEDELVKALLLPLTDFLRKAGHVGPVDANAIVNEDGIHFLEFTARFGYDAIQNFSLMLGDFPAFLKDVAHGKGEDYDLCDDLSMSVRLSMPPYPFSEDNDKHANDTEGMKVVDVPEDMQDSVMLVDCMEKDGEYVMSGVDNIIGTVHAVAPTIEECKTAIYGEMIDNGDLHYREGGIIDEICITQDVQMRRDIGCGVMQDIKQLAEWGYCEDRYSDDTE